MATKPFAAPRFADRDHTVADGTRLRVRVGGTGDPAIVFVHGWCSNLTHWQAQLGAFAPAHRVLAMDRRGHGASDAPPTGYTARRHAADLAEILDAEDIAHAVVIGHAGGCPTVLSLAATRRDLVRALVLVDTRIGPKSALGRPHSPERSLLGQMVDRLRAPDGAEFLEAQYRGFFSEHAGPEGDQAVRDARRTPLHVAAADLASLAIDTEGLAARLRQPVLWIGAGALDEQHLRGVFRDVQFGRVVGSGHFPQLEVPNQVNGMIERFVATLPAGR